MADDITNSPPTAPTAQWFDAFEAEIKGHMQNRGLDKLDPAAAALEAMKAHRAAEKRLGAPADELVRFPKEPGDAAWSEVFKRLGKPDAPEGYDLSTLAKPERPLAPELVSAIQAAAHKANMTPAQAVALTQTILEHQDGSAATAATEQNFQAAAEAAKLRQNWGADFETNLFVAQRAAAVLGISPEAVAALEKVAGYSTTMDTMRKLGVAMGEARVIQGQGSTKDGIVSADQAQEWLNSRKTDSAWLNRWANGGTEEIRDMERMTRRVIEARYPR